MWSLVLSSREGWRRVFWNSGVTLDCVPFSWGAVQTAERSLLTSSNRKAFCWQDEWFGLNMDDIRKMEDDVFAKINKVGEIFPFLPSLFFCFFVFFFPFLFFSSRDCYWSISYERKYRAMPTCLHLTRVALPNSGLWMV